MTIAAKLSRKFYETLGDEAAESMIDWMHGVDANRTELRELHDLSFDRFDARLGERLAQFREELRGEMQEMREEMRDEIRTEVGKLSTRLEDRYADLIKWSFAFWIGSVVTLMLGTAAITRIGR